MEQLNTLLEQASQKRMVFFTGLPGVGKSLYVKLLSEQAQQNGREVHILQWDVTRSAFETDEVLAKYPEIDGVTHAIIRKSVGLWSRQAVLDWHTTTDAKAILIGELPLIGNRLIELVQRIDDEAEKLLSSDNALLITPVPSRRVREVIEEARANSIASPKHHKEEKDAPPNVLTALWEELHNLAITKLNFQSESNNYNPDIYASVYEYLLKHRHFETLHIDEIFKTETSVYDVEIQNNLAADLNTVQTIVHSVEQNYSQEELEEQTNNWHQIG